MHLRNPLTISVLTVVLALAGCKTGQQKANEQAVVQARQQAALTGAAQQVVYTDTDGSRVTTVVQPPAPGQATQQVTTTRSSTSSTTSSSATPAAVAAPALPATNPLATPASSNLSGSTPATAPNSAATGPIVSAVAPLEINVPRGTSLAIRINQQISVKNSHAGDRFTGEVVRDVTPAGTDRVAIPHGTPVNGVIDAAHRRGHFKGRSILELRLTSLEMGGQRYQLDTRDNVRTKKGKGKRSAAFIGGGTGLGMLIGGVASGGVGLLVGGLAGAGAGTGIAGLTGNRDIEIPAESVMNFTLADDLAVRPPR